MRGPRSVSISVLALGVVACLATACSSSSKPAGTSGLRASNPAANGGSGRYQVGVILPDTQSSSRYELQDRPDLARAFAAAGIRANIQNAQGDKAKFATIADGMIQQGVDALIVDGLDSPSAAAVEQKAKAAGVRTIDYDRYTIGGTADYYVSFDNVKVGELIGQGLVACLGANKTARVIEINGSPTDNNASLFKQGYDRVLSAKYAQGWTKVGDQSIPNWDNTAAGTTFEQLLSAAGGKVDGVVSAWDGGAQSIITVLKKNGLRVPVTGDDATPQGLQSILRGDQCMTVFKPAQLEAQAAASLAISLIKKGPAPTTTLFKDPQTGRSVPAVLLPATAITKTNVKDVIAGGGASYNEICSGDIAALCANAGITG